MPKPEKFIKLPILEVMVRDILCGLESSAGDQFNSYELTNYISKFKSGNFVF